MQLNSIICIQLVNYMYIYVWLTSYIANLMIVTFVRVSALYVHMKWLCSLNSELAITTSYICVEDTKIDIILILYKAYNPVVMKYIILLLGQNVIVLPEFQLH